VFIIKQVWFKKR